MKRDHKGHKNRAHLLSMCAIALVILVGTILFYLPFERPHQAKNVQPLLTGWSYHTGSDPTPVDVPVLDDYIPFAIGEWLTLSRTLTERAEHPALLVRLPQLRARIYLDDVQLFENLNDPPGESPGSRALLINLPDDYLGKQLRLELSSPYSLYAYSPDPIYFGDAGALATQIVAGSARNVALLFVLVISGVLLLGMGIWGTGVGRNAREQWSSFCFGLFSILYGLSLVTMDNAYRMAFPALLGGNVEFILWYLFPIPLLCFLYLKCTGLRRVVLVVTILFTAVSAGTLFLALLGFWQLPLTLVFMNPVFIAMVGVMLAVSVLECVKKNAFFRMISPAFLLLCGSAVLSTIDIGGFYTLKEYLRTAGILLLLGLVWSDSLRGHLISRRRGDEERHLLGLKTELAREQFEAASARNQETHFLRHEIRHHLVALMVMQREGNLGAIGDYLKDIAAQEQALDIAQYCEHPLVNAILSKTAVDCRGAGIDFQCEAYVPKDISIPENNLSGLLLNLLENAFEAARQAPEASRWIAMQIREKDQFLVISCRNGRKEGTIPQREGRFHSTKPDVRLHGYGILAMQRIAEKHGSKLNIDYDENSFSVKTILRLNDA